jgi:L-iditol 2-dehydrogenase
MKSLVFDPRPWRWVAGKLAGWATRRPPPLRLAGLTMRDMAAPSLPFADWVRVRVLLGGVCGTDLAMIGLRQHPASVLQRFVSFPAVMGHENVGVIEEVGPAVHGWRVGQRVCVEPSIACAARRIDPPCAQCAAGRISLCENSDRGALPPGLMIGLNSFTSGSWSGAFVAHESQLFAAPDAIPDHVAVLVDPIACAVHAVLRRPPAGEERVLVLGGGMVGVCVVAAIRALGIRNHVAAVVRHGQQADLMRHYGADSVRIHPRRWTNVQRFDDIAAESGGRRLNVRFGNQAFVGGFDLTYECLGSGPALTDALKWTRGRGTLVVVGTSQICLLDATPLWFRELQVIGCSGRAMENYNGRSMHTYEVVFDWLASGRFDAGPLTVRVFPLSRYQDAFAELRRRSETGIIKAAFVPE